MPRNTHRATLRLTAVATTLLIGATALASNTPGSTAPALGAPTVSASAATGAAPTVTLQAPAYDSPGALVPAIVTIFNPPKRYAVRLTARASSGATVRCLGDSWYNPVRRSLSRKCYVSLPTVAGSHRLTGVARLTTSGVVKRTITGAGSRPLLAKGHRTRRMSLAAAQRIERCHNTTPYVQLTFDDGGSVPQVRAILETLRRNGVRGRFFFRGDWAHRNPSLIRRMRREGHLLANHTYDHPPLNLLTRRQIGSQIRRGLQATTSPKLLRPPYAAGALTRRVSAVAAQRGYQVCRWTTDTYDWEGPSATVMADRVRYGDYRTMPVDAGGVILMHGTARYTSTGLQKIIRAVQDKGLRLEPLRR